MASRYLVRKIDRFVDLSEVRVHREPYYGEVGRPSIDPELMIRTLIIGYCFGIWRKLASSRVLRRMSRNTRPR
jgi:hypothetical protein